MTSPRLKFAETYKDLRKSLYHSALQGLTIHLTEAGDPAQIALAWLVAQKPWIVPIPGATKLPRLEENIGALNVKLTLDDFREIEEATAKVQVQGARLPAPVLTMIGG